MAVREAKHYIQEGRVWVVDMDLSKFFDRVNHNMLMARIAKKVTDQRVLKLICAFLEAGVMENGVSTAILRELAEETGFTSLQRPILLANLHSNPAIATNQVQTFLVLDAYKVSEQNLDDTEEIEVKLIPLDQVAEKIHSGQITQIFSVAAYYMAAEYLKKHHIF